MLVLLRGFCLGLAGSVAVFIGASGVKAQAVGLTEKMAEARIALDGREIVIARNQDETATITGDFSRRQELARRSACSRSRRFRGLIPMASWS